MIQTTLTEHILGKYPNPYFFETGTAHGDCVQMALKLPFEKIFSIEIDPDRFAFNCRKFANLLDTRVFLFNGDTAVQMKNVTPLLDKNTTFWLDAHVDEGICGISKCPLDRELSYIKSTDNPNHTILIDDMRLIRNPSRGHWSEHVSLAFLLEKLREINPNYQLSYEDGFAEKDILVAHI